MNFEIWGPVLLLTAVATVTDVLWRRIPNWLTLPLLAAGICVNAVLHGVPGLVNSFGGVGLAVLLLGSLCWLQSMGLGDLKLCAAIGAWVGPSVLMLMLLITAMAGGLIALGFALFKGQLGMALDRTASLLTEGPRHSEPGVADPEALTIPYAPAIATGVVFAFLAS
jgi:prepilin peptidase CpaA